MCSTELLYGMDDSIFVAHHMDANCTSIFTGTLEPKNCNGIGQSITCSDGGTGEILPRLVVVAHFAVSAVSRSDVVNEQ